MPSAVFDYYAWITRYPEFGDSVPPGLAAAYFDEATAYLDNTDCSPVADLTKRLRLLNMITAHIAALNGPGSSPLVGRISNASEGSVSVSADLTGTPAAAAWWMQTKYGAAFWEATKGLRTFRYFPGRQPIFDVPGRPNLVGVGWPGWPWRP
jgi:hypothetical protein